MATSAESCEWKSANQNDESQMRSAGRPRSVKLSARSHRAASGSERVGWYLAPAPVATTERA
eukprot:3368631-Pleurochrysis_carterae.AAC.1